MDNTIRDLYETILSRKESAEEKSYTAYLFEAGLDKILKKVGEESTEVVIAAKNFEKDCHSMENREELKNEICDLLYHVFVMMVESDISMDEIDEVLDQRSQKSGNLKERKIVDKNT